MKLKQYPPVKKKIKTQISKPQNLLKYLYKNIKIKFFKD